MASEEIARQSVNVASEFALPTINVPSEDGEVSRAFADLEARLTAWTSAAANVQQDLATRAARFAEAGAPAGSPDISAAVAAVEDELLDTARRTGEVTEEDAALLKTLRTDMAAVVRMRYEMLEGRRCVRDLVNDEEHAWLDSLDPEMAKTIRVQRRLFKNRRSLHELIAEYEAENGAKQAKKGWWKRRTA